jgi:hypothetical protein
VRIAADGLGAGCYQIGDPVVDLGGELSQPVGVEIGASGSIEGTLGAVPAAAWAILLLDSASSPGDSSRLAYPDSQGHFVFPSLRPGRYRIAAGSAADGARNRWVKNFSDMQEIEVHAGGATRVDLPQPALQGGAQ